MTLRAGVVQFSDRKTQLARKIGRALTIKTKINRRTRTPGAARAQRAPVRQNEPGLADTAQRAAVDPRSLSGKQIIQLQRAIGNRAVNRLLDGERSGGIIQARLTVGAADDAYEREADPGSPPR